MTNDPKTPNGAADVLAVLRNEIEHAGCLGPKASDARAKRLEKVYAAVAALIARNAELEADAGRWREVSDKAWFIDAAAYVYGLRSGTFEPTPDEDEVIAAIDAARAPAKAPK